MHLNHTILVFIADVSAGNKIPICQQIIVQCSSKFQVAIFTTLSVIFGHLSSYTAVRDATCQD
jgi:hypothetical protein